MSDLKKFIKSTGIYFLGNVLAKLIAFIMLPIYTRYISPNDFGAYDLSMVYINFFTAVFFLDIWIGVMRFFFDFKEQKLKDGVIFSGMLIFAASVMISAIFFFIFAFYEGIEYKLILFMVGILLNIVTFYSYVCRTLGENKIFVIGGVVAALTVAVSNTIMLVFLNFGYESIYLASIFGGIINILIMESRVKILKKISFSNFNFTIFKQLLFFSFPLCLNSLSYWFAAVYGRMMIAKELSLVDNGIYAVALRFGAFVQILMQCFNMAWQEVSFAKTNFTKKQMGEFYSQSTNEYIKFMILGIAILLPCIKMIFAIVIGKEYEASIEYIPLVLIGIVIYGISLFLMSIMNSIKATKYMFLSNFLGAICNVVLLHCFIIEYKVYAVATIYAITYLVVCAVKIIIINRHFKLSLNFDMMIIFFILYGFVGYLFIKFDYLVNLVTLTTMCSLFIIVYRNMIKLAVIKIKNKINIKGQ